MRAGVALLLFGHPYLCADFTPPGYGTQDNFLADRYGEIIDEFAGEIAAPVAALDLLVLAARFDRAYLAIAENTFR
jgi:hypothetical protein